MVRDAGRVEGRRRLRVRFSLAMLLVLLSCVAGFFGGYRYGYEWKTFTEAATKRAQSEQVASVTPPVQVRVYMTRDLVDGEDASSDREKADDDGSGIDVAGARLEALAEDVKQDVFGGRGVAKVAPYATNLSLVVSGDARAHEAVAQYLNGRRAEHDVESFTPQGP